MKFNKSNLYTPTTSIIKPILKVIQSLIVSTKNLFSLDKYFRRQGYVSFKWLIVLGFSTSFCTFFKSTPTSEWQVLETTEEIDCDKWPLSEDIINIDEIKRIDSSGSQFLGKLVMRNGEKQDYYMELTKGKVSLSKEPLKITDPGALYHLDFEPSRLSNLAPFLIKDDKGKHEVQLRKFPENVVKEKFILDISEIYNGEIQYFENEIYLSTNDETPFLHKITTNKSSKFPLKIANTYKTLINKSGKVFFVDFLSKEFAPEEKRDELYISHLAKDKSMTRVKLISGEEFKSSIESWGAKMITEERAVIALFEGDSLINSDVRLWIIEIDMQTPTPEIVNKRTLDLSNNHVSDPEISLVNDLPIITFMRWMDNESTLSVVKIKDDAIDLKSYGVFPQGTSTIDVFSQGKSDDWYSLMRYRDNETYHFQLCEFDINS